MCIRRVRLQPALFLLVVMGSCVNCLKVGSRSCQTLTRSVVRIAC